MQIRHPYSKLSKPTALIVALLACPQVASPAAAEQESEDILPEIREYLGQHLGRWESGTTYFDIDGNVTREEIEGYGEKVLIEDQVNLHFSYNKDGTVNTALRFYSAEDDKYYLVDVTHDGRVWIISANRGESVFYSQEKELPDGRKVILKITHENVRQNAFEAIVEVSFDGGGAWRKLSHQDYKKIGENPDR